MAKASQGWDPGAGCYLNFLTNFLRLDA
ncbi:uncharacterized protein METZ01_LOCUS100640, partial [marine metagenome]